MYTSWGSESGIGELWSRGIAKLWNGGVAGLLNMRRGAGVSRGSDSEAFRISGADASQNF